jgi:hypothetical protein
MPKNKPGAREVFVAPPGHAIVSVDFDAFEMRTWSQTCLWILGYSNLAGILNDPKRCPHKEMGCRLENHFNSDGTTWQEQYEWVYGLKDKGRLKAVRGLAKGPNFGLPGGMGAERLMDYCRLNYGVVLTLERAEQACSVWREIYSEAQPYLDHVKKQTARQKGGRGTVEMFVSRRLRGDVGFTDGSNGYFQGLAADAAKAAGVALTKLAFANKRSPMYGARPLAFVHDEWLYAVPLKSLEQLHEAAYEMARVQVATAQQFCPDVLITASPGASFRWSKAAGDPVHNSAGLLIPFECLSGYDGPPPAVWHRDLQERFAA